MSIPSSFSSDFTDSEDEHEKYRDDQPPTAIPTTTESATSASGTDTESESDMSDLGSAVESAMSVGQFGPSIAARTLLEDKHQAENATIIPNRLTLFNSTAVLRSSDGLKQGVFKTDARTLTRLMPAFSAVLVEFVRRALQDDNVRFDKHSKNPFHLTAKFVTDAMKARVGLEFGKNVGYLQFAKDHEKAQAKLPDEAKSSPKAAWYNRMRSMKFMDILSKAAVSNLGTVAGLGVAAAVSMRSTYSMADVDGKVVMQGRWSKSRSAFVISYASNDDDTPSVRYLVRPNTTTSMWDVSTLPAMAGDQSMAALAADIKEDSRSAAQDAVPSREKALREQAEKDAKEKTVKGSARPSFSKSAAAGNDYSPKKSPSTRSYKMKVNSEGGFDFDDSEEERVKELLASPKSTQEDSKGKEEEEAKEKPKSAFLETPEEFSNGAAPEEKPERTEPVGAIGAEEAAYSIPFEWKAGERYGDAGFQLLVQRLDVSRFKMFGKTVRTAVTGGDEEYVLEFGEQDTPVPRDVVAFATYIMRSSNGVNFNLLFYYLLLKLSTASIEGVTKMIVNRYGGSDTLPAYIDPKGGQGSIAPTRPTPPPAARQTAGTDQ